MIRFGTRIDGARSYIVPAVYCLLSTVSISMPLLLSELSCRDSELESRRSSVVVSCRIVACTAPCLAAACQRRTYRAVARQDVALCPSTWARWLTHTRQAQSATRASAIWPMRACLDPGSRPGPELGPDADRDAEIQFKSSDLSAHYSVLSA